ECKRDASPFPHHRQECLCHHGFTDNQVSNDTKPTTYNLPPCGGGRRMSSRRDDVRRVGGIVLPSRFRTPHPLTRFARQRPPHTGGGVKKRVSDGVVALLTVSSRRRRARTCRTPAR